MQALYAGTRATVAAAVWHETSCAKQACKPASCKLQAASCQLPKTEYITDTTDAVVRGSSSVRHNPTTAELEGAAEALSSRSLTHAVAECFP